MSYRFPGYPPPPPAPRASNRGWYASGADRMPSEMHQWLIGALRSVALGTEAPLRTLVLAGVGGLAADRLLEAGIPGIGLTLFALLLAVVVFVAARGRSRQAQGFAVAAALLASSFSVLSSVWVLGLCGGGVAASLLVGASLSRGGDILDLSWGDAALRVATGVVHALLAGPWLLLGCASRARALGGRRRRPLVAGLLLALPLVIGLGLLLAAADPLFASLFAVNLDPALAALHMFLVSLGAVTLGALLRMAIAGTLTPAPITAPRPGSTESVVVLGGLATLLGAFTATQVAAGLGAGRDLLVREGISYADYARSGYFELIAVVMIIAVVLPMFRTVALGGEPGSRWVRILCAAVVLLTLAIGVVAMRRLWLYDDAFGLTVLRLCSAAAAVWFGVVLLLLAASVLGVAPAKSWFPGATLITLLVVVGGVAALNPEAYVARSNVAHVQTAALDTTYLSSLSDDAVPALVAGLPTVGSGERAALRRALCAAPHAADAWSTWTLARSRAAAAREVLCRG